MSETVDVPQVVGLVGRKGAGKDTAALILTTHSVVKFAGPLKEMLASLLRYRGADEATILRMLEGDLKEVPTPLLENKTPRHAMQTIGTEWGRDLIGPDLWVNCAKDRVREVGCAVITDVRFQNEIDAVEQMNGVTVRITRPDVLALDDHLSESLVDRLSVDDEIVNDGTPRELQVALRNALSDMVS